MAVAPATAVAPGAWGGLALVRRRFGHAGYRLPPAAPMRPVLVQRDSKWQQCASAS
jgi:hypothetical protein